MKFEEKVFIAIVLVMLLSSMVLVFYTKNIIKVERGVLSPPTAKVLDVKLTQGKIIITILINDTIYPINVTGGYVQIYQTNQTAKIPPFSLSGSKKINVTIPFSYEDSTLSLLILRGLVQGIMNGSLVYITFSSTEPIHVVYSIDVKNVTYSKGISNLTLYTFFPVNYTVISVQFYSIVNDNLSIFIARTNEITPVNLSFPAGENTFSLNLNYSEVFYNSLMNGNLYTFSGKVTVLLHYPGYNESKTFYVTHEFLYINGS
ncbi:hypothetical protein [Acidianus sp. RZ1]|uniref:hypothetical protein n=1 Tax=Acidianus sp. RZ1 TaxID=1540082 RepID=UPI0014909029|nr:hypothetical protein [Acidianus sp. RZ1]NON63186.1 hypothetical protein [Acidianus sp. RZ1]